MEISSNNNDLHIVILSSPGMGHLIPVLVLANRLASVHNIKVTVFLVTTDAVPPPDSNMLKLSLDQKLVEVIQLPPVDISHLVDSTTQVVTQLCIMVRESLPLLHSAIASMDRRPDALFVDHFGNEAHTLATEFGMAKYIYVPSTAWFTALTLYCPILDQEIQGEYVEQQEYLKIPGCKPIRPEDVVDPMLDRNDQQYEEYVNMGKRISLFDGILLNSWEELEPKTLLAFKENNIANIPIYPVGPLTRPKELKGSDPELMKWLNEQPHESVVFVSFGSGGVLSAQQIIELAWGLELSQQRFIWVVRPPTNGRVDDAFFIISNDSNENPDYLPDGFLTRTRDIGKLVPMWAQQVEILNHPSIGGFMSHCGWNSTLESIINGVPIIAWPLYAEQRLNATLLTEELAVALKPEVLPTKEVVGREEILKMVRILMESEEGRVMRKNVKKLKMGAIDALSDHGSSHKSMCQLVKQIVLHVK